MCWFFAMLPIHAAFWRSRMQGRFLRARLLSHAGQIFCAFTVWRMYSCEREVRARQRKKARRGRARERESRERGKREGAESETERERDRKPLARQYTLFQLHPQSFSSHLFCAQGKRLGLLDCRFCIYQTVVRCLCWLYNHTGRVLHAETFSEHMMVHNLGSVQVLQVSHFRSCNRNGSS